MSLIINKQSASAYTNITSATTTVVRVGKGVLRRIVFNKPVSASTVTLYDNISATGSKIATITNSTDVTPYYLDFDLQLSIGLTVVTDAAIDLTIVYD